MTHLNLSSDDKASMTVFIHLENDSYCLLNSMLMNPHVSPYTACTNSALQATVDLLIQQAVFQQSSSSLVPDLITLSKLVLQLHLLLLSHLGLFLVPVLACSIKHLQCQQPSMHSAPTALLCLWLRFFLLLFNLSLHLLNPQSLMIAHLHYIFVCMTCVISMLCSR